MGLGSDGADRWIRIGCLPGPVARRESVLNGSQWPDEAIGRLTTKKASGLWPKAHHK